MTDARPWDNHPWRNDTSFYSQSEIPTHFNARREKEISYDELAEIIKIDLGISPYELECRQGRFNS